MGTTGSATERSAPGDLDTNGDGGDLVTALLPTRTAPERDDASEEQAGPEWEYRTELARARLHGLGRNRSTCASSRTDFDALGQDGWELLHVSWNHRVRRKHGGHLLIFKRPKS